MRLKGDYLQSAEAKRLGRALTSLANIFFLVTVQLTTVFMLGVGEKTDSYYTFIVVPQFLSLIQTTYFQNFFVPKIVSRKNELGYQKFLVFYSLRAGFLLSILSLMLTVSLVIVTSQGDVKLNATFVSLCLVASALVMANAVSAPLIASKYANEQFSIVELSSISASILALIFLLFSSDSLTIYEAIAVALSRSIISWIPLISIRMLTSKNIADSDADARTAVSYHYMLNLIITKSDPVIDRTLLANTNDGTLTLHALAYQLTMMIASVMAKTFGNESLTRLANLKNSPLEKERYLKNLIKMILVSASSLFLLMLIGLFLLNEELAMLAGVESEQMIVMLLMFFCLSGLFFGGVLRHVVENLFHSKNHTTKLARLSSITFCVYFLVKVMGFDSFGVYWICVCCSVYVLFDLYILHKYSKLI